MRVREVPVLILLLPLMLGAQKVSLPEWKLSAAPQVAIGGEGSPRTEFQEIVGAWRLPNQDIAVVNGATSEIRIFDARGAFLRSFGRQGDGPGEFQRIGWSGHFGDTSIVYDVNLQRITTIRLRETPNSIAEQTLTLNGERPAFVAGRLADGRWLMYGFARPDLNVRGAYRIPGFVGVAGASGTGAVRWLAEMPDMSVFTYADRDETKIGAASGNPVSFGVTAFPARMVAAASGQSVWVGDGATDSIIRIDATTGARKSIKLPAGEPLTRALIDRGRSREMEGARDQKARDVIDIKYGEKLLPKRLPTFETFVVGPRGELWVHRGTAFRSMSAEYFVLGPNGVPIARVTTAPGFRITDVGSGYVVGVHKDDDGVETVRLYGLRK